jgi:hypothetical protein
MAVSIQGVAPPKMDGPRWLTVLLKVVGFDTMPPLKVVLMALAVTIPATTLQVIVAEFVMFGEAILPPLFTWKGLVKRGMTFTPETLQVMGGLFWKLALVSGMAFTLMPPPLLTGSVAATACNWVEMLMAPPVIPGGAGAVQLKQNFWLFKVE